MTASPTIVEPPTHQPPLGLVEADAPPNRAKRCAGSK